MIGSMQRSTDWRLEADAVDAMPPEAAKEARPSAPSWWRRAALVLRSAIGPTDVLVALGLLLVSRGCYLLQPAAGWLVPGVVILWYALPQRPRFMEPKPPRVVQVTAPGPQGAMTGRDG